MKHLRAITDAFLVFTTSTVSALHSFNSLTNPAPSEPPTIVKVPGWTYRGCYTDQVDARTLTGKKWTGNLTPGRCAKICGGYRYFAVEAGNERVLS